MIRVPLIVAVFTISFPALTQELHAEFVVDFESFPLRSDGYFNGPVDGATAETGPYGGTQWIGTIDAGGVGFSNSYNETYGSWSGFSISNRIDTTTAGYLNQFSAFLGSGAGGSSNYAVGFGYHDAFDRNNVDQLRQLPSIYLPDNAQAISAQVTNTTYAVLSMQEGDGFAKAFGGASKNDPDFFKLSVFGIDANNQILADEIEFFLADYRFDNNNEDYIIGDWRSLDLSSLSAASSLHFNLTSSDSGEYGMNTPSYFAIDNLTLNASAVPEPSSLALLGVCASLGLVLRRTRRNHDKKLRSAR